MQTDSKAHTNTLVRTHLDTHITGKSSAHEQMFRLSPRVHAHILRGWLIGGLNLLICVRKSTDGPGHALHLHRLLFFLSVGGLNKGNDLCVFDSTVEQNYIYASITS